MPVYLLPRTGNSTFSEGPSEYGPSTDRSRHLSLSVFQACRPRPLPPSLSSSLRHRAPPPMPPVVPPPLSKSVRRASPTSTGFLPIATSQTDRRGAQPEVLLLEQKGITRTTSKYTLCGWGSYAYVHVGLNPLHKTMSMRVGSTGLTSFPRY